VKTFGLPLKFPSDEQEDLLWHLANSYWVGCFWSIEDTHIDQKVTVFEALRRSNRTLISTRVTELASGIQVEEIPIAWATFRAVYPGSLDLQGGWSVLEKALTSFLKLPAFQFLAEHPDIGFDIEEQLLLKFLTHWDRPLLHFVDYIDASTDHGQLPPSAQELAQKVAGLCVLLLKEDAAGRLDRKSVV